VSLNASRWRVLFERLRLEAPLAPGAALAADAADQFDVNMATLLTAGDPAVVAEALARVNDDTLVLGAAPPHEPIEGGYGRHFGAVTVGDKAKFLLNRLLGEARSAEAIAQGPAWCEGRVLRWQPERRQFR
jgi:hypothetical protein